MAYYLENTALDAYVGISIIEVGASVGDYFQFEGYANAGNVGDSYRLAGLSTGFGNILAVRSSDVLLRADLVDVTFSTGYVQPAAGELFKVRVERTASTEWTCFLNGVSIGSGLTAENFRPDQFLRLSNSTIDCFLGGIKKIAVKIGSGTRIYDPSLSGGTGSTLPTDDGLNQGTLVNFPVDDSEWVFYSASTPTISSVPATAFPGQSITLGVTGAGATQGTGGVTLGGVAQTVTNWSDTSITFTTVLGTNSYGTGKTVELTTDAGGTATGTIELVANTAGGFGAVEMSSPNTTDTSSVAYNTTPTVVTGDWFEWEDFNSLGNLTIDAQGFVSNVDTAGTFRGRFWDATDSTWGTTQEFTASVAETVAPTVTSASVPTAGNNIAVQMSEAMQVGAGGSGGWTASLGDVSITTAAVDGTDATIVNLTPSRTLTTEDTLTIGYTQPGDGFQDQATTPNDLATFSGQAVTNGSTQAPPDVTAPVFSSAPAVSATTTSGHTLTATLDEAGTIYGVRLVDGATAPSSTQVKAGQNATGAAALEVKSSAAAAATPATLVFSTASSGTAYDYYMVAEDDETTPNVQASPTLVQAATSIEPPPPSVPGSGRRGFLRPAVRGTVNSIIGSIIS